MLDALFDAGSDISGLFSRTDSGCASSPDGFHAWLCDPVAGFLSNHWDGNCLYCGTNYKQYKTGTAGNLTNDDIQYIYHDYVHSLPTTGIDSKGRLIYTPAIDWMRIYASYYHYAYAWCPHDPRTGVGDVLDASVDFMCNTNSFAAYPIEDRDHFQLDYVHFQHTFDAPIDGKYLRIDTPAFKGFKVYVNGASDTGTVLYDRGRAFVTYDKGYVKTEENSYKMSQIFNGSTGNKFSSFVGIFYPPKYLVIPADGAFNIDVTFNVDTRPSNHDLNIGIDVNGTIQQVTNNTIINEAENIYYNPVTDTTNNITDWSFDYIDRTYELTLDNGLKASVTYGDDYISVIEGENVYKVYYVRNSSSCAHEYTEEITKVPTCIDEGIITFTCTKCGYAYTQSIAAAGHTWKCSTCGEEYETADDTRPPDGAESDSNTG